MTKAEVNTRLLNQENSLILVELANEQYTQHERRLTQELEEELEEKLEEEEEEEVTEQAKSERRPRLRKKLKEKGQI